MPFEGEHVGYESPPGELLEVWDDSGCDAWGWRVEVRTSGFWLRDLSGYRFLARNIASDKTVTKRAEKYAIRTNKQAAEYYGYDMTEDEAREFFRTF